MMRLVLVNPHVMPYGKIIAAVLLKRRSLEKYQYVLDHYIKHPTRPTAFLIDGTRSSFNTIGITWSFWPKFWIYLEVLLWMLLNKVNPFNHPVYFNVESLNPENDIIFNFSKSSLDGALKNHTTPVFRRYSGINIIHVSHFFKKTSHVAKEIKELPHGFLVAEADVSKSDFFRQYFGNLPAVYQLPFMLRERYKSLVPFPSRQAKCLAIGSLVKIHGEEYEKFYGSRAPLHPIRQLIYDHQQSLTDIINSQIVPLDNQTDLLKQFLKRYPQAQILKRYIPYFILEKLSAEYHRQYFGYDIVKKYNEYQMFISAEERIGLPSINAFEGMACGCALVAINHPMYRDIGLEPNIHYIAYEEGNLYDLRERIEYYQQHQDKLEPLALRGRDYVTEHFNPSRIALLFWSDLEKLRTSFIAGKPVFTCSFLKKTDHAA